MSIDYAELNKTARGRVLALLSDLEWHGHRELYLAGGVRYGARVLELKRLGYAIEDLALEPQGKQYRLTSLARGEPQVKRVKVYLDKSDVEALLLGLVTQDALCDLITAYKAFLNNEHKL